MHDYRQLACFRSSRKPGPKMVLEAVIAPHSPKLLAIVGVLNFEEILHTRSELNDPTSLAAWSKIEHGPEPPFDT